MGWDDYIRAVLRIELPGGTLRIKPVPLGKPHVIGFPDSTDGTVHLITAFNPGGPGVVVGGVNERLSEVSNTVFEGQERQR